MTKVIITPTGFASVPDTYNPTKEFMRKFGGGGGSYGGQSKVSQEELQASLKARQEEIKRQEEARKQAEEQAKRQAEEQAKRQAEEQAKRQAEQLLKIQKTSEQTRFNKLLSAQAQSQPYIKKELKSVKGSAIPEATYKYVEPQGQSTKTGVRYTNVERPATPEEIKQYQDYEKSLSFETGTALTKEQEKKKYGLVGKEFTDKSGALFENLDTGLKESITYPTGRGLQIGIEAIEKRTGLNLPSTLTEAKQNIRESTEFLMSLGVPKSIAKAGEFTSFYGVGLLEGIKEQPLKYGAIAGISAGIGFGASALTAGAGAISPTLATGVKALEVGTGAYFGGKFLYGAGIGIVSAKGTEAKANILADITLTGISAGAGYKIGGKVFDKISVLGREYVPIEDLVLKDILEGRKTFVESESYGFKGGSVLDKQRFDLKVFKDKKYGYHTTPDKFFIDYIKASEGSSEFKGLYVAPDVSIYFSKVGGGYKLLPSIKDLLSANRPAIAKIYGKDFDISSFYKTGKGYKFTKQELGVGYVSGIKPEIEAIFPVGSEFIRTGTGKYTTFKGRNILLDEFSFIDSVTKNTGIKSVSAKQVYSSYNLPSAEPILTPEVFISTSYKSSNIQDNLIYETSSSNVKSDLSFKSPVYVGSSGGVSSRGSKVSPIKSDIPSKVYSDKSILKSVIPRSYKRPSRVQTIPRGSSYTPYYDIGRIPEPITAIKFKSKNKQRRLLRTPTYSVFVKRRGQFKTRGTGLTRGEAIALGSDISLKTLGRTFRIKQTGFKEQFGIDESNLIPDERLFRSYKVRRGKRIAQQNTFIQRTPSLLQTQEEKRAILQARQLNKLIGI